MVAFLHSVLLGPAHKSEYYNHDTNLSLGLASQGFPSTVLGSPWEMVFIEVEFCSGLLGTGLALDFLAEDGINWRSGCWGLWTPRS